MVLDAVEKRKIACPYRESNPVVQPVVRRYTNWAIPMMTWYTSEVAFDVSSLFYVQRCIFTESYKKRI
jgi:hypothetical protein